jgi:gamma-glutamyl-gamma-aminobutyrate hydrolase PuuD
VGCDVDYVKSVMRSGGAPLLLPFLSDGDSIAASLAVADGVLMTGGGDINPLHYGEEPHPKTYYQDPARDEMEFELARRSVELGKPVLGICRGIQALNVAFGGTLVQDIPSQIPCACRHFAQPLAPVLVHNVDIEPDSLLSQVLGATSLAVNSYHHQSVKDVGSGLRVNCRARDGVVEGLESSDGKPVLAVQCHPEELAAEHEAFQRPFDWLIAEAAATR